MNGNSSNCSRALLGKWLSYYLEPTFRVSGSFVWREKHTSRMTTTTTSEEQATPWVESALDWFDRSRQQTCENALPKTPGDAAWRFVRGKTGLPFIDLVLESCSRKSPPVIELVGPSGTGKTWTMLTLAARFLSATRPSLFGEDIDSVPQVVVIDALNGVFLKNLIAAVQAALLRSSKESVDTDQHEIELTACLKRVHLCNAAHADELVPVLESMRCHLKTCEHPTLVLWDGSFVGCFDEVNRMEVIRQIQRLLRETKVYLISTSTSSRRAHSAWDRLVKRRIQMGLAESSDVQHDFVASFPGPDAKQFYYSISWGSIFT